MDRQEKVNICETRGRERTKLVLTITQPNVSYTFYWTTGNNRTDFYMTGTTVKSQRTYVGDVKAYLDPEHPRDLYQYPDFMINYDKLMITKKRAMNDKNGRTPIIIAVFPTYLAIWDLNKCKWEHTAEWRLVEKTGVEYGSGKEWNLMGYLKQEDATIINYNPDSLKS